MQQDQDHEIQIVTDADTAAADADAAAAAAEPEPEEEEAAAEGRAELELEPEPEEEEAERADADADAAAAESARQATVAEDSARQAERAAAEAAERAAEVEAAAARAAAEAAVARTAVAEAALAKAAKVKAALVKTTAEKNKAVAGHDSENPEETAATATATAATAKRRTKAEPAKTLSCVGTVFICGATLYNLAYDPANKSPYSNLIPTVGIYGIFAGQAVVACLTSKNRTGALAMLTTLTAAIAAGTYMLGLDDTAALAKALVTEHPLVAATAVGGGAIVGGIFTCLRQRSCSRKEKHEGGLHDPLLTALKQSA